MGCGGDTGVVGAPWMEIWGGFGGLWGGEGTQGMWDPWMQIWGGIGGLWGGEGMQGVCGVGRGCRGCGTPPDTGGGGGWGV